MNHLTLSVAGGRKTQSIVEACVAHTADQQALIITYTQANQQEISARLDRYRPLKARIEVIGWFSFLLGYWVRPYLPMLYPSRRLTGLNFEGDPGRYVTGQDRFLDAEGRAYKRHLAKLGLATNEASGGAALDRLSRIFPRIYVDEVQDLNGYDLDVLEAIMGSPIKLHLVGDIRQALIQTNIQDPRHRQFLGPNIKHWFDERQRSGLLTISQEHRTWRCNQLIADFADSIFDESWNFARSTSLNNATTGHDGVFAVDEDHVEEYLRRYNPLCLRHSISSATHLTLPFVNIGVAKGASVDRVLIAPTANVVDYLRKSKPLGAGPSCSLYVAVTRARSSVAFVVKQPERLGLPVWVP